MTIVRCPGVASVAVIAALAAGAATAQVVAPDWSRDAGLDVWNFPSAQEELSRASEEEAEVEAFGERSARRREAAAQITARLIGGAPLSDAAEELHEVFRDDGGVTVTLEALHPDAPTERHRYALHLIDRSKRSLWDDEARYAAVVARLEAEYKLLDASPESPAR